MRGHNSTLQPHGVGNYVDTTWAPSQLLDDETDLYIIEHHGRRSPTPENPYPWNHSLDVPQRAHWSTHSIWGPQDIATPLVRTSSRKHHLRPHSCSKTLAGRERRRSGNTHCLRRASCVRTSNILWKTVETRWERKVVAARQETTRIDYGDRNLKYLLVECTERRKLPCVGNRKLTWPSSRRGTPGSN